MTYFTRTLPCLAALGLWLIPANSRADEPYLEFLEGLRHRGYYDTALEYLEEIERDAQVPADVKQVLPYERGQILLDGAKNLTGSKAQREQLDAAQAAFEAFVKGAPNHPLAGRANTERARILMEKARVDIWDAEDPANREGRGEFQKNARQLIAQARQIFDTAFKQHDAAFREFPLVIPEEERERRRQRDEAEQRYLRGKLDLTECTYWEAQTYDIGSEQRKEILKKASEEFSAIHEEHRSQIAGLIARLWQGKCFEEMGGMLRQALGIYNEILEHGDSTESMRLLKARALRFRLICLNTDERKDFDVVIKEGTDWRNNEKQMRLTDVGMGILYETARAQFALGSDRTRPEAQRRNLLTQALTSARQIARYPGELKAPSNALITRVAAALNLPEKDPEDFEGAFGRASQYKEEASRLNDQREEALGQGKTAEAAELQQTLQASAAEMTRLFDLALRLAKPETDAASLAECRTLLAYGYFLQEKYYEAAAAADYAALHIPQELDEAARQSAFIRLAAFNYAYINADKGDRKFEEQQQIVAAEDLIARWPESDFATESRTIIANMHWNAGDHATAAEWWAKVPPAAKDYAKSQLQAGQAYWAGYDAQTARPEAERAPVEQLNAWRAAAEKHLETGVQASQAGLPQNAASPSDLILGKLTLAQIRNLSGIYATQDGKPGAIQLLEDEPHSVLKAVEAAPGKPRPKDPSNVKSSKVAGFAYQQLLRAYIGVKNLDRARAARALLEAAADSEDAGALTQIYVAFGQELQKELEQLRASGESSRLDSVRSGFEDFLNDLSQRSEGQTFDSLLWIAQTYTGLAEGSDDSRNKVDDYFSRAAATYATMARKAGEDPSFLRNPDHAVVIKLSLADCLRRQEKFEEAEPIMLEALKASPNAPNVQFEAARLYKDWAGSSSVNWQKYETAIGGRRDVPLWGWADLASRLQKDLLRKRNDDAARRMHVDARYNLIECYHDYALEQPDNKKRTENLAKARSTIEAFARLTDTLSEAELARFDRLYARILKDLGQPAASLASVVAQPQRGTSGSNNAKASSGGTTARATPAEPAEQESSGSTANVAVIMLLLIVGAAAVVGLYFLAAKQNKRRPVVTSSSAPATTAPRSKKTTLPS
jgi:hypothetical protein